VVVLDAVIARNSTETTKPTEGDMALGDEIQALRADIQSIHDGQVRLEATLKAMQPNCLKRFDSLEVTVFGNGSSGLKSDITRLKVWMWMGAGVCGLAGTVVGFLLEKCFG